MNIVILELWGLGDAVLMTAALQAFLATQEGNTICVLAKKASVELLRPSYPTVLFIEISAPWTAFRRKYLFWQWNWPKLAEATRIIRSLAPACAVSVRPDPRDHILMFLAGATRRIGFPRMGSQLLLTDVACLNPSHHRAENWQELANLIVGDTTHTFPPRIFPSAYVPSAPIQATLKASRPFLLIHCGAAQPVRRWPLAYFRALIGRLHENGFSRLLLVPDPDGYGLDLADIAPILNPHSVADLATCLAAADAVIANDSGPAHISAALGIPTAVFFGPQISELFRPYGERHLVLRSAPCPRLPCSDNCIYPEPFCMTSLRLEHVWPPLFAWLRKIQSDRVIL